MASSTEDAHSEPAAAEVSPAATALPPELLDQLVTRFADEVSCRMSSTGGVPQIADALTEVPFTASLPASSSLVQDSITAVQMTRTGTDF